jgi:hypothetical protein
MPMSVNVDIQIQLIFEERTDGDTTSPWDKPGDDAVLCSNSREPLYMQRLM